MPQEFLTLGEHVFGSKKAELLKGKRGHKTLDPIWFYKECVGKSAAFLGFDVPSVFHIASKNDRNCHLAVGVKFRRKTGFRGKSRTL